MLTNFVGIMTALSTLAIPYAFFSDSVGVLEAVVASIFWGTIYTLLLRRRS